MSSKESVETRLRLLAESDDSSGPKVPQEIRELAEDAIELIEQNLDLLAKAVERVEATDAERRFYAQTLVAISVYKGSDNSVPMLMAAIATAETVANAQSY